MKKKINYLKFFDKISLIGFIYFIVLNVLGFFNKLSFRHLHIDERIVIMNPVINVYQKIDFYSRFTEVEPEFIKNILIVISELVLGGTLDYGRLYKNLFVLIAGPFSLISYELVVIVARLTQFSIVIFLLLYFTKYFIKKELRFIFIILSLGLPGAYYIIQNPKPDSLALLFFIIGLKKIHVDQKLNLGLIYFGMSIGVKIITIIPIFIFGLILIYPLKKIQTLGYLLVSLSRIFIGVVIAQPALLLPISRIYKRVYYDISNASNINFQIENFEKWILQLVKEFDLSSYFFYFVLFYSFLLLVYKIKANKKDINTYFLIIYLVMFLFICFNVERTWTYFLFIPYFFLLAFLFQLENYKNINILIFISAFVLIGMSGLLLHNNKAFNSGYVVDEYKDSSFTGAIEFIDRQYNIKNLKYNKIYWDPDYYFPGRGIDYFSDFIVLENWESEYGLQPLKRNVDFIVTTKMYENTISTSSVKFGDLYVYFNS